MGARGQVHAVLRVTLSRANDSASAGKMTSSRQLFSTSLGCVQLFQIDITSISENLVSGLMRSIHIINYTVMSEYVVVGALMLDRLLSPFPARSWPEALYMLIINLL